MEEHHHEKIKRKFPPSLFPASMAQKQRWKGIMNRKQLIRIRKSGFKELRKIHTTDAR